MTRKELEVMFRKYAPMCAEAYEPGNLDTFVVGNDRGFMHRDRATGELIVAIAGTDELIDWLPVGTGNGNIETVAIRDCLHVHSGFMSAAMQVARVIREDIDQWLLNPRNCVTFCGHSRGGAIAQILPLVLNVPAFQVSIVCFASPKCMYLLNDSIDPFGVTRRKCVLFESWADVVPHVPATLRISPYRKYGTVVRRRLDGAIDVNRNARDGLLRRLFAAAVLAFVHVSHWRQIPLALFGMGRLQTLAASVLRAHALTEAYDPELWWEDDYVENLRDCIDLDHGVSGFPLL